VGLQESDLGDSFGARLSSEARAVLQAHFQTMGGVTRLSQIQSAIYSGSVILDDSPPLDLVVTKKSGGYVRLLIGSEGNGVVLATSPDAGWRAHVEDGRLVMLRSISELERAGLVRYQAVISELFLASKENWEVRYQGLREWHGDRVHAFEVVPNKSLRMELYIDADSYLFAGKTEYIEEEPGVWTVIRFRYSEHENFDGVWHATQIDSSSDNLPEQSMTLGRIQFNHGVLNDFFAMPDPEANELIPASLLTGPDQ
jgi:hypothetical protein